MNRRLLAPIIALTLTTGLVACSGSGGGSSVPKPPSVPPTYAQASSTLLPETLAQVESGSVPVPIPAFDVLSYTGTPGQPAFMGYVMAASQSGSVWTVSGTMQAPYTTFTPVGTHCSLRVDDATQRVVLFQCDVPN